MGYATPTRKYRYLTIKAYMKKYRHNFLSHCHSDSEDILKAVAGNISYSEGVNARYLEGLHGELIASFREDILDKVFGHHEK